MRRFRLVRTWIVPLVCLAVAGIALAAALLTEAPSTPQETGAFVLFPESSTVRWNSLDDGMPLTLSARGDRWLAFRAFAPGGDARLSVRGEDGSRLGVTVGTTPKVQFVGPLPLAGFTRFWLMPDGHERIFLSELRLFPRPLAALPGAGFFPPESSRFRSSGRSWLSAAGTVDVASARPEVRRAWLDFDVVSIDEQRTLTVTDGRATFRVSAPEKGPSRHVTVGPFRLKAGRTSVRFASPGPRAYGTDPRRRSVQVIDLEALASPAERR